MYARIPLATFRDGVSLTHAAVVDMAHRQARIEGSGDSIKLTDEDIRRIRDAAQKAGLDDLYQAAVKHLTAPATIKLKVMLAEDGTGRTINYPVMGSPKLDGWRGVVLGGVVYNGRSGIPIPNAHCQQLFGRPELEGFDGELIVGNPVASNAMRATTSGLSSKSGKPSITFLVFDIYNGPGTYQERYSQLQERVISAKVPGVEAVEQTILENALDLAKYEVACVSAGFEGVVLRVMSSTYRGTRSTAMLKLKRFVDDEAEIIEVIQEERAGKLVEAVGAFRVRDLKTNIIYKVGTGKGLTIKKREDMWRKRAALIGETAKVKHWPSGAGEKPRWPSLIGVRPKEDMP
jgi:DNA ligase-1